MCYEKQSKKSPSIQDGKKIQWAISSTSKNPEYEFSGH